MFKHESQCLKALALFLMGVNEISSNRFWSTASIRNSEAYR